MPKKTKKQKVRTQLRRTTLPQTTTADKERPINLSKKTRESDPITAHTIMDLRKTVVVALLVFALEFLIFYANLKGVSLNGIL